MNSLTIVSDGLLKQGVQVSFCIAIRGLLSGGEEVARGGGGSGWYGVSAVKKEIQDDDNESLLILKILKDDEEVFETLTSILPTILR